MRVFVFAGLSLYTLEEHYWMLPDLDNILCSIVYINDVPVCFIQVREAHKVSQVREDLTDYQV